MLKIAFVFDDLNASQPAYQCIKALNSLTIRSSDIEPSIFFIEQALPCIEPKFARYHVRDSLWYEGHLIATSVKTAMSIKLSTRAKRYFYIQDLEWLRQNCNTEDWKSIMEDDNFIKICRCKDHAKAIHEAGFIISPAAIENYNIQKFVELING